MTDDRHLAILDLTKQLKDQADRFELFAASIKGLPLEEYQARRDVIVSELKEKIYGPPTPDYPDAVEDDENVDGDEEGKGLQTGSGKLNGTSIKGEEATVKEEGPVAMELADDEGDGQGDDEEDTGEGEEEDEEGGYATAEDNESADAEGANEEDDDDDDDTE
ncbi:hypothetical protein HK104_010591 [Borealophlyctis nickersoniae]|nr:hypothetical protein HK104_010591 [Borealophlyctis nickersoniae]